MQVRELRKEDSWKADTPFRGMSSGDERERVDRASGGSVRISTPRANPSTGNAICGISAESGRRPEASKGATVSTAPWRRIPCSILTIETLPWRSRFRPRPSSWAL